ncbi:MAG: hypothetical protein U1E08_01335 [Coriobacteriia bacterium]|nr:hypothetical protein [Actinomycetota bacterium]MDZ4166327.1 hypothetical protein [Coriobacteriia bacterium]
MTAYLPPLAVDVRVRESDSRGFRIWFPVILLWPLLFAIVGFVLLVTLLVDLALLATGARYHHYTLLVVSSLRLLAEVRGTHVDALSDGSLVKVDIY